MMDYGNETSYDYQTSYENKTSFEDEIFYDYESPCDVDDSGNASVKYYLQVYVHSLICIVGFIGNVLVILTYAFYKRTKSMTDVYLLNVAIADVLFVVALPLIIFSEQSNWALGDWSCKLLRGVYSINLYSGILLLACISLDRYLAIVQARRSFRFRSSMLVYSYVICAVVWLSALLLTLPTFMFYERYAPRETFNMSMSYETVTNSDSTPVTKETKTLATEVPDSTQQEQYVCFFRFKDNNTAKRMKVLVPSAQVAVGFCFPLLVMGFCYSSVVFTLLRAKNFQRHKAVRVVLTVVLVFIICHLPYNAALFYDIIYMFSGSDCEGHSITQLLLILTESLAYLHCCLNPLLYAFIGVKFRNHFRKVMEDLWCLGKSYIGARRTSRATSEAYLSSRRSVDSSGYENGTSFTM
ncbi:C-C chemokine receptor type 6a [Ictalurus punctatus]|uniref:C-C chemokine receptor type 6a n=1 Tax=Ictalurus punctatus TaxID=7998 RepID=A0A2D0Q0V0_ICTPU|nr:C-C chemokine receptor type 6a [Ictalurus punctatus]